MPYYDIEGIGTKTNRKRHKRYLADNEEHAIALAKINETEVVLIELVEPGPATEKQIKFAKDLGLSFPCDINVNEMSSLLSRKLDNDSPAPKWLLETAWELEPTQKGLSLNEYSSLEGLVSFIHSEYFKGGNNHEMVIWFLYFVVRDKLNISWDKSISEIYSDYSLESIATELEKNESVLNSIRRYSGDCLLHFGEYTDEEGYTSTGGSNRTASYKEVISLLKSSNIVPNRKFNKTIKPPSSINQIKPNSGCLGASALIVLIPVVLLIAW